MLASRLDEIVRDYTRELEEVTERLRAERACREMAEERAQALEAELALLRAGETPVSPGLSYLYGGYRRRSGAARGAFHAR